MRVARFHPLSVSECIQYDTSVLEQMLKTIDLIEASCLFANDLSDGSSLDVKLASKIIPKLILNLMVLKSVQAEEMPNILVLCRILFLEI